MVKYHPYEAYLQDYAVGRTSEAVGLVLATHLSFCASCRQKVEEFEAVGGAVLAQQDGLAVTASARDRVMAMIDFESDAADYVSDADRAVRSGSIEVPGPLKGYLSAAALESLDNIKWRQLPGYAEHTLLARDGEPRVRLMKISAGVAMPKHTHEGTELTLVLQGGFSDHSGCYGPGDLAIADGATEHAPRADDDGDCICLAVTDSPLRLTGVIGRLINPFVNL